MQEYFFNVYQNSLNYNSLITTQLQPNYNFLNFKLVSTILGIFLWNFQVTFLKYVFFEMFKKSIFVPGKIIVILNQKSFKIK